MIDLQIQKETGIRAPSVSAVLQLFGEGATVPFIARYRKERTGGLDEVQIIKIQEEFERLEKLEKRKETVISAIRDQDKLTPELSNLIKNCWDLFALEDIYLPYKRSRKTKADIAKENGLEPLAKIILDQRKHDISRDALQYVRGKIGNIDEALEGARHIIAEWINENISVRNTIRSLFKRNAIIESKVVPKKSTEATTYKTYFNHSELLSKCPSHRLLAMLRGDEEGFLKVKISIDEEEAAYKLNRTYIQSSGAAADQILLTIQDALKRLILPSIENEFRKISKEKADKEAIEVFVNNLRQLLLAAPLGTKAVIGLDPGFRTGCKAVILDDQGTLLHHDTIYPHPPQSSVREAMDKIQSWITKYGIENIAIGNGTAGRETYQFLRDAGLSVSLHMVNENGASIYSASQIARDEFPDLDLTVRGAVSIGRRLMDPLAELVKIDPKSIGVGQYQHDVNQGLLKESLDRTVISCVNTVGINLNTASHHLLQYVAGVGPLLAKNIVEYRNEIGGLTTREQLINVPRMGKKAFEQAAGFLRIRNSKQPLDNTGIHPERYLLVQKMLKDHKINLYDLEAESKKIQQIHLEKYVDKDVGLPTLLDIIAELQKPGLDTRGAAKSINFSSQVREIEDLKTGMILTGIVNNITKFGAFVDLGIKESALLHISQITNKFIKDPSEVLALQQEVEVKVIELDLDRKRISLTMKF